VDTPDERLHGAREASVLLWLLACADAEPTETGDTALPPVDCAGLDWDSVGAPFVYTYCTGCHSATTADRGGAPVTVDLDTYEGVVGWLDRVRVRAVTLQNMPPTGGPPDDELAVFGDWLRCGAPE
jgi:uncharacterized membrane protein